MVFVHYKKKRGEKTRTLIRVIRDSCHHRT